MISAALHPESPKIMGYIGYVGWVPCGMGKEGLGGCNECFGELEIGVIKVYKVV